MVKLSGLLAAAGLVASVGYVSNTIYHLEKIDDLNHTLERAKQEFDQNWRRRTGCPLDLVRNQRVLEEKIQRQINKYELRTFIPWHGI